MQKLSSPHTSYLQFFCDLHNRRVHTKVKNIWEFHFASLMNFQAYPSENKFQCYFHNGYAEVSRNLLESETSRYLRWQETEKKEQNKRQTKRVVKVLAIFKLNFSGWFISTFCSVYWNVWSSFNILSLVSLLLYSLLFFSSTKEIWPNCWTRSVFIWNLKKIICLRRAQLSSCSCRSQDLDRHILMVLCRITKQWCHEAFSEQSLDQTWSFKAN